MPIITTPVGRLVYGHPSKLIQKTDTKRQPIMKDGKPVMVRSFGVAFPKDAFNAEIWPVMYHEAKAVFQGYEPPMPPTTLFSYKFKDGDGVDKQMRPYSQREGYAGHCVVHFETQFDLIAYRANAAGNGWDQITENDYKTGDYIRVSCSIEGNKPDNAMHTPGLFINPQGILLIGHGAAIVNAPTADQMFGGVGPSALPPGATPPGSAPPMPAGMPNAPGFGGAPAAPQAMPPGGYAPQPGQPPMAAPAAAPQYQPQPQPQYQPQPQPQQPTYAAPPGGYAPQPAPAQAVPPGGYAPQPGPAAPAYPPHDLVGAALGQPAAAPQAMPPGGYAPQPGQAPAYPTTPPGQPPR